MEITEIKSRLCLSVVIKHYGFKADKHNRICCPFHGDKSPSMQLYYKTHTAYCFSSNCKTHGKSMDVIDFILHKENFIKAEAIKKAIELLGGKPANEDDVGEFSLETTKSLSIDLVSIPYDYESAAISAEKNKRNDWASWIRKGRT
jgi:DNA primase